MHVISKTRSKILQKEIIGRTKNNLSSHIPFQDILRLISKKNKKIIYKKYYPCVDQCPPKVLSFWYSWSGGDLLQKIVSTYALRV